MIDPAKANDLEGVQRFLAGVQYPADFVARACREIHDQLLRDSPRIRADNFAHIATTDLALLFDLYDATFFDRRLRQLLDAGKSPLSFQLSRRLTRSAGSTTRFQPRRVKAGAAPEPTRYEIAISTNLLFQTFAGVERTVRVNGLVCRDRVEALQRVLEHELLHLLEMLVWGKSSCSASRFKALAWNYFGHTETVHDLVTAPESAAAKFGVRVGDRAAFVFEGVRRVGVVNRITRRATVLVETPQGAVYSDGKRYQKFYVPVTLLQKAP
jgi:hypothetical protein